MHRTTGGFCISPTAHASCTTRSPAVTSLSGCCRPYYTDLPTRPAQVNGWKKSTFSTFLIIGSFVLSKGESTENGKLGVTIVDIQPSLLCKLPLAEPGHSQIEVRFYKPSDRGVLCETMIFAGSSGSVSGNLNCPDQSEMPPSFTVRNFNAEDGWLWLELTAQMDDPRW